MYFKKIEMHGFKSFAEPVTIDFSSGITCIVGPNGSGKSNISDAIRWVLGEQSPKMLRGGKMEEVIFAGTSSRKSRGMAEVTLVIDNAEGTLPIDYKEVALTRRMFRSGESEYHINGNQCRLRDIRELIMDTGIGVDGYSIIGQGKISEILSNKTESRREIFEEAAGIVLYRTKKAESERKLEAANANMDRVQDIIGEIEGRIDGLREDSIKAKEYLQLRDRYKELEINIILKNIENLKAKGEELRADMEQLNRELDQVRAKRSHAEQSVASQEERKETLERIAEETRQQLMEVIDTLNQLVNQEQLDKERMTAITENQNRLTNEIGQLQEKLQREEENQASLLEGGKQTEERFEQAKALLDEKTGLYDTMSQKLAELMQQVDQYKSDVFDRSADRSSAEAEIGSLQRMAETLEKRKTALLSDKDTDEDSNKETLDHLNQMRHEQERIAETLEHAREQRTLKKEEFAAMREDEKKLSRTFEELRIAVSQLSARKKTIEEMESNYEGYNYAVRYIMRSSLSGIHGVVADLIQVPEGYETAIETALGAALQNIVCEDDEHAKAAIRALKANKAGRLTFLPVSSVRGRTSYDERLRQEAGFRGFGPECLHYDAKYQGIISYLLGRVVIVDDMDHAVRMSKKGGGLRFVTLDGEVINAGGAITGGKYKNKTANILDRKAEIQTLEKEIHQKEKQKSDVAERLESLRSGIGGHGIQMEALEEEIRTTERVLLEKEHELKLTEAALREIRSSSQRLERELSSIETEKKHSMEMVEALQKRIAENTQAIVEAERKAEACLEEYQAQKERFDSISEEITNARIQLSGCEQEKSHLDSMKQRIQNNLEELGEDIRQRQHQYEALMQEAEKLTGENGSSGEQIQARTEEKNSLESRLEQVGEEKAELMRALTASAEERDAFAETIEKLQNQKYELDIRNTRNETQLDTYKNKLWEDFEISYIQAVEFRSEEFVMSAAVKESRQVKSRIRELGEVNVGAIEEYETVRERYEFLTGQRADIQEAADDLHKIIDDMDRTIRIKFKESFDQIVINFEEKFRELFGGGHAELRLSNEDDPLTSNIDIVAQPPGKKLQNINLLSGGEKTLTAIALMFAVLKAKPTPFCILDEVEAALDDANIDRFISCLRKLSGIQFALVTHQKATMEHADVIYGVTMPEKGVSRVLSLDMDSDFAI